MKINVEFKVRRKVVFYTCCGAKDAMRRKTILVEDIYIISCFLQNNGQDTHYLCT